MINLTPRLKAIQVNILSLLLDRPRYYSDLQREIKSVTCSSDMFYKSLTALLENGIIKKTAERNKIWYSVNLEAIESNKNLFRTASLLREFIPLTPLRMAMSYLSESSLFNSKEDGVYAAVLYWAVKYRDFSIQSAFYCLLTENYVSSNPLEVRKSLLSYEEKYYSALLDLNKKYPDLTKKALTLIASRMKKSIPISLTANGIAAEIQLFLKSYCTEIYVATPDIETAIYSDLRTMERFFEKEFQLFYCSKKKKEAQSWICGDCTLFRISDKSKNCKYKKPIIE